MSMFLHKLPAVQLPQPVIYGAAILLATFYFWFTRPAEEAKPSGAVAPRRPEI